VTAGPIRDAVVAERGDGPTCGCHLVGGAPGRARPGGRGRWCLGVAARCHDRSGRKAAGSGACRGIVLLSGTVYRKRR